MTRLRPAFTVVAVTLSAVAFVGALSFPAQAQAQPPQPCTTGPNGPACHAPGVDPK
ncbi:hypothetical protein ABT340_18070 [Streptosporangium sp. NPDC000239]|uniref:hypothetical protein n=1 Tax=Streptosporangium sp. NPDC000239 TaxID=3154248 RepID=UPI003320EF54